MKLVLSRKGFDSTYGGMPSPILPDGTLVPLPIPSSHDAATFADLDYQGVDLGALLQDLSRGRHSLNSTIHLDPELDRPTHLRLPDWRPVLGQTGAAQRHLARQGVGPGDVFLFFGWFREADYRHGHWRYRPDAPDLHVLFGWLEVADTIAIVTDRQHALKTYPWCSRHPHAANPSHYNDSANTLYVSAPTSRYVPSTDVGGGRFRHFSPELQLTRPGSSRTHWSLPGCFMPNCSDVAMTYHTDISRWQLVNNRVWLQSVSKGQEFVMDCAHHPGVETWVADLIRKYGN